MLSGGEVRGDCGVSGIRSTVMAVSTERFETLLRWLRVGDMVEPAGAIIGWSRSTGAPFWSDSAGTLWTVDTSADDAPRELIALEELARLLEPLAENVPRSPSSLGAFRVREIDHDHMVITASNQTVRVDFRSRTSAVLPRRVGDAPRMVRKALRTGNRDTFEAQSPDSSRFVGTKNNNLYLRANGSGDTDWLTRDGTADKPWELFSVRWSPDGKSIATVREDHTGVPRQPLIDWLHPDMPVSFHPQPRGDSARTGFSAHIIAIDSGDVVSVDAGGARDDRFWCRGWSTDSTTAFVLHASRDLRHLQLLAVDRATGSCRVAVDEVVPTFFSWADLDLLVRGVEGWSSVLWRSERDGWAHLYRYDTAGGGAPVQVTHGELAVVGIDAIDTDGRWVYFRGQSERRPYDVQVYRAQLDGSIQQRLTDEPGQHTPALSPDRSRFIDRVSSLTTPPRIDLVRADGTRLRTLAAADTTRLEAAGWQPPEEVTVVAADGSSILHGALFLPFDMDSTCRYPVLAYVYGGPQNIHSPKEFLGANATTARAYAQAGFVVLTLDSRGTPGRGKAFHDVSHRRFGTHVIDDHVVALAQLAVDRPWLDLDRVGIFGGSWGGHITIRAMLEQPQLFKAGAATAPATRLGRGASSIEPFMGHLDDNPAGYSAGDLTQRAAELQGPLLLIHGTDDFNVPLSATLAMARALADADKDVEMLVMPGENHVLIGSSWRAAHRRRLEFFTRHLHPAAE